MSSMFGEKIKISIFGESHGECVGAVVDGLPAGFEIDREKLSKFMSRRAPGGEFATKRTENDDVKIVSGLFNGKTSDSPLCVIIENNDARSADYGEKMTVPRPGHADYTSFIHSDGFCDFRGGGHNSGRLTAPLCAVGNVLMQILEEKYGVKIYARLLSVGDVKDGETDYSKSSPEEIKALENIKEGAFPVVGKEAELKIKEKIKKAAQDGDSLGGCVECVIYNLPAGLGEPMFDGAENLIAHAVFAIPGVKGIEFGNGFEAAGLKGSEENDEFLVCGGEKIETKTNNCGGILGGRTDGMPVVFRAAFKPTPSIAKMQKSVNLENSENAEITVKGRHDPCIAQRAVPCVEAAAAIAVSEFILQ